MAKEEGAVRPETAPPAQLTASEFTAGHRQTSSTNGACRFCGAPALRPTGKHAGKASTTT